jgi:hypothetical protein
MTAKFLYLKNNKFSVRNIGFNFILPIPLVKLTSGLFRSFLNKDDVAIVCKQDWVRKKSHLSLLMTSRGTTYWQMMRMFDEYERLCRKDGMEYIEATIVNKKIKDTLLKRLNWKFVSRHWYFGNNYSKKL